MVSWHTRQYLSYDHARLWSRHHMCLYVLHSFFTIYTSLSMLPFVSASASIRASDTICFRVIFSIHRCIFTKLLWLVHLGTKMNWSGFGVRRSKVKVTLSRRRRPAPDAAVKFSLLVVLSWATLNKDLTIKLQISSKSWNHSMLALLPTLSIYYVYCIALLLCL